MPPTPGARPAAPAPVAVPLSSSLLAEAQTRRVQTGIPELDRVLGGGLVDGSVVLLGADPGCGKSTLALQVLAALADPARDSGRAHAHDALADLGPGAALYASGEESVHQIALRADRLGLVNERISVHASDDVDAAIALAGRSASLALVVDSIQTMRTSDLDAPAGSVAQVGACAGKLARFAKDTLTPVLIIGQVTKTGEIAGPKALEHLVDVVLYLEAGRGAERSLTSPKNRFGSTAEVGAFVMGERGLACAAKGDRDRDMLAERAAGVPGSAVFPAASGDRVALVEIQALVGAPKEAGDDGKAGKVKGSIAVSGIDAKRVQVILAVLERHAGINVSDRDVFVSVTGGMKINDPAADLPIALAIASSVRDLPIDPAAVCFGEIGLAGEIRSVALAGLRCSESRRAGFGLAVASVLDAREGLATSARNVAEAIETVIGQVAP